ncbi:MAG: hypothetical protein LQ342_008433 [Letrouitia transgressa]|nr:MAG: hypothetical protein LQ342_008433 [Letrouitia transgressa]
MALEAAFQYSSLQGNTISPSSEYRLREVTVSRSMVLEEDIPTEVTLVMRPQREGTHSISKTWNHFLVCSWTQKGGWIEHCQGLISVKVDSAPRTGYDGATEELEKTLDPVDIHARFSKGGLEFGPAFRNITSVHASLGHSVGTVTIPDTARMMPFGFENIHIIHPGTFDACFQLVDAAASGGDLTRVDLHVPTFVKSISVRHGLPKAPGDALTVCARAGQAFSSFDPNIRGSFAVFDSETTRLIEVNGLVASKLPSTDIEIGQSTDRSLCYKMVWEPCVDLIKFEQFTNVFCRSLTISGSTTQAERLDKAAFWYIQSAVGCISAEDLDRLPSHLQKYYEALGTWLEQGKQASLPLPRRDWLDVSNSEKQQLIDDLEALDGSGRLVCRIGQALPSILKGEVEPLSIMLKDDLLGAYYKSFGLMNRGIEIAASIIASLGHQTPHMKILEVGAGTGSSTIPMLRALGQRFARYDFTDISTGFFEAARREQTQWADRISKLCSG